MQGHGAVDHLGVADPVHVGIHAGAGQAEHHGLVAYQSLVVTLHIGHGGRHADRELAPDGIKVPGLVLLFLDEADPHVRKPHGQAIVKADAAALDGDAHAGHAGHVLGDGDGAGPDLADQGVGQLQIGNGLGVGVHGEVHPEIGKGGAQAVIVVEHAGDAVKTEAVEVILLQPELQVREQEMEHLGLSVIEALGPPGGVFALRPGVEELILRAVKHVDALDGVLDGVRVYQIEQDGDAEFMGAVDQVLEILGIAEAAGSGEKAGDLITEGTVIGVFHDRHELNGVVAEIFHPRQNIVRKLTVSARTVFLGRHTDVGFIDQRNRVRVKVPVGPGVGFGRIPYLTEPVEADRILYHTPGVERDMSGEGVAVSYHRPDPASVVQGFFRQAQLPVAVFQARQGMRGLIPAVEVAHEIERVGSRRPLAVDPTVQRVVEAIVCMGVGEIAQIPVLNQRMTHAPVVVHTQFDVPSERNQRPILLKNLKHETKSPSMLRSAGEAQGSSRAREELR